MFDRVFALFNEGCQPVRGNRYSIKIEGLEAEGGGEFDVVKIEDIGTADFKGIEIGSSLNESEKIDRIRFVRKSCISWRHSPSVISLRKEMRILRGG